MKAYCIFAEDMGIEFMSSTPANYCCEVDLPDGFDLKNVSGYRYIGGELVFDANRLAKKKAEAESGMRLSERNDRYQALVQVQLEHDKAQQMIAATDDPDTLIALMPGMDQWAQRTYAVGDIVSYHGAPYRCVQAHDATGQPDWTPEQYRAGWANYHARSKELALPWAQPLGAHGAYMTGEWMIWTDGNYYECVQDNDHSPEAWPQGWQQR